MNKTITPATHREMIRLYPIAGVVEGWYFREEEVSSGNYLVEGCDLYGRQCSCRSMGDSKAAMDECIQFAKKVNQQTSQSQQ